MGRSATPEDSRPGPQVQLMAKVVSGHGLAQALSNQVVRDSLPVVKSRLE